MYFKEMSLVHHTKITLEYFITVNTLIFKNSSRKKILNIEKFSVYKLFKLFCKGMYICSAFVISDNHVYV